MNFLSILHWKPQKVVVTNGKYQNPYVILYFIHVNCRITTRMDVVYLTPVDEDSVLHCSSKVIVSTITREQAKNIAVVLAEDIHTSQILRCDVIVDSINSLTITTTAKELFMEEAPEAFEVRAYDDQGKCIGFITCKSCALCVSFRERIHNTRRCCI